MGNIGPTICQPFEQLDRGVDAPGDAGGHPVAEKGHDPRLPAPESRGEHLEFLETRLLDPESHARSRARAIWTSRRWTT